MAELVLLARLDLLRRNLAVVERVLTVIDERFHRAPTSPPGVDDQLLGLLGKLRQLEAEIEDTADSETMDCLVDAKQLARSIKRALQPEPRELDGRLGLLPQEHDLEDDLVQKAREASDRIDQLEQRVGQTDSVDLWNEFHWLEIDCQQLFYEYVDLVRGVALRSSGVDRELCLIADDLVRTVSRKWRSITIPSRRERMRPTSGRIIRIGFPEWTIWNLPLVAHEYGHVFADVIPELAGVVDEAAGGTGDDRDADRREVESLVADAFAAITLGPAYGCAAMLTRLDAGAPQRELDDGALTRRRAEIILRALERQALPAEAKAMVDRLRTEWSAAVEETGFDGPALDVHRSSESILDAVEQQCIGIKFPYDRWTDFVTTTSSSLRGMAAGEEVTDIRRSRDVDMRHVLNAAWLCRVPPAAEKNAIVTDSPQLEQIAECVRKTGLAWLGHDTPPDVERHGHQRRREGVRPTWND